MPLSETQHDMLNMLSDGALYNIFAWPLCRDTGSPRETWGVMWASALLVAKGLAEVKGEDESALWISITPKGKAALASAERKANE